MNIHHRPRKRFGQHFLHDPSVIDRIVTAMNAQPGQHIIEIGPGRGALTMPLLEHVQEMHVVELDRDLVVYLAERCQGKGLLHIHSADVLKFDFSQFHVNDLRIVSNLPYNISTPVLFHLLDYRNHIRDMLFMMQQEVVERLCATPGNRSYGRLTVMLQCHFEIEPLFNLGPEAFSPPPRVNSAVVRLIPRAESLYEKTDVEILSRIVKLAFSQRRKTLSNAMKGHISPAQLEQLGIAPTCRAENLSLAEFVALANLYRGEENQ